MPACLPKHCMQRDLCIDTTSNMHTCVQRQHLLRAKAQQDAGVPLQSAWLSSCSNCSRPNRINADGQAQKGPAIFQSGSDSDIGASNFFKNYATQDGKREHAARRKPCCMHMPSIPRRLDATLWMRQHCQTSRLAPLSVMQAHTLLQP